VHPLIIPTITQEPNVYAAGHDRYFGFCDTNASPPTQSGTLGQTGGYLLRMDADPRAVGDA
jgi:hypothetical protein